MAKNFAVSGKLSGWYINFGITAIALSLVNWQIAEKVKVMPTAGYAYAIKIILFEMLL